MADLPNYKWKTVEEVAWFVLIAVLTTLMQILITLEPEKITDWETYFVALFAAAIRAAAGAILAYLGKRRLSGN